MNHQGGDGGGVGEAEVGQGDFKEVRFVICDCVVVGGYYLGEGGVKEKIFMTCINKWC